MGSSSQSTRSVLNIQPSFTTFDPSDVIGIKLELKVLLENVVKCIPVDLV